MQLNLADTNRADNSQNIGHVLAGDGYLKNVVLDQNDGQATWTRSKQETQRVLDEEQVKTRVPRGRGDPKGSRSRRRSEEVRRDERVEVLKDEVLEVEPGLVGRNNDEATAGRLVVGVKGSLVELLRRCSGGGGGLWGLEG